MAGEILLQVRGVCKQFPGVRALQDVDLQVRAGHVGTFVDHTPLNGTLLAVLYRPEARSVSSPQPRSPCLDDVGRPVNT